MENFADDYNGINNYPEDDEFDGRGEETEESPLDDEDIVIEDDFIFDEEE